jgi:hypothetical protein
MLTTLLRLSVVNTALYLATCALVGTGLMLELRMGRDDWGEHHITIAIVFLALTVLHLFVNRAWIAAAVTRAKWVVPMLAVGFGLIAVLLLWPTDHEAGINWYHPS